MVNSNEKHVDQGIGSSCVDAEWYLEQYKDVKILGMDPAKHFLWLGKRLNRKPNSSYVHNSSYLLCGANTTNKESILTTADMVHEAYKTIAESTYFDKQWYSEQYATTLNGEDPISHYLRIGASLGLDPSPLFSTSEYLDYYRDVQSAGWNPLYHFIIHGREEGRIARYDQLADALPLVRFTPMEKGMPQSVLQFDVDTPIPISMEQEKIVIHLHLYHTAMADEILYYLLNVKPQYTLLISVKEEEDFSFWQNYFKERLPAAKDVIVKGVSNRGRDVAPWLVDFKEEIKSSTIFCHLHTKRSVHNKLCNIGWFRYLSHTMLGSDSVINQILGLLCGGTGVGLVGPCYFWGLTNQPSYGSNRKLVEKLYSRLTHQPLPEECLDFPAGSFFWARTEILQSLFELNLTSDDFPEEQGQVDGTIAHAIERLIGLLPSLSAMRYHMITVDVAYDLTRYIHLNRKELSRSLQRHTCPPRGKTPQKAKIAVFSCLSGDYEESMPLLSNYEGIDCFLFSDNDNISPPPGFSLIQCNYNNPASVRTARFVKTHPHIWFSDYDYVVWIDSNIHFFGDLKDYIMLLDDAKSDCGFILHPARTSADEECKELIKEKIVDLYLAQNQMERYLGCPEVLNQPLFETNFFICRPKSNNVIKFFKYWWSEINRYTHRDQISVGYAMHKANLKWTPLLAPGRSAREHHDFVLFQHGYRNRESVIQFLQGESR